MSIVSNVISAVPGNFSIATDTKNTVDLSDNSFSDLLEQQMQIQEGIFDKVTVPSWMAYNNYTDIEGFNIQDLVSSIQNAKKISNSANDKTTDFLGSSEMVAFLTSPFNTHSASKSSNNDLANFAQRQAANFYNKCASNVVTGLTEFVEDALKL